MSESFESVMAFALKTTSTECMSEDMREWCYSADGCQDCTAKLLNRLQRAHEHEIEQMRKEMAATYELTHCPSCETRLKKLDVQHAVEHASRESFHCGYLAGQHSKDADHAAVAMRLRGLRFDGGSHENLNKIAYAIYPCATGWTVESCEGLRDKIIELLGGVHDGVPDHVCGRACGDDRDNRDGQSEAVDVDDSIPDGGSDVPAAYGVGDSPFTQVMYDVLGNERHKAVCELRKMPDTYDMQLGGSVTDQWYHDLCKAICIGYRTSFAETRDRLIHLLGGDEPTAMDYIKRIAREHNIQFSDMEPSGADEPDSQKSPILANSDGEDSGKVTITDELREWYRTTPYLGKGSFELCAIADRIDAQFARLCEQQEAVLQDTIDDAADECDRLIGECNELQAKLDEADAAIANYKEREKSFAESERLRENLTHDVEMWRKRAEYMRTLYDDVQAKLDVIWEAVDE